MDVAIPHSSGQKYAAKLAKLDDPTPEKAYRDADREDRWKFSLDTLRSGFEDFKHDLNISSDARLTVDGDAFQQEWFEFAQSEKHPSVSEFSSPDFYCKYFWANDLARKVQTSKACMAKMAGIKGFRCSISTKQDQPMKLALASGILVLTVHDNHTADSAQYDAGMFDAMARVLPECAKAFGG